MGKKIQFEFDGSRIEFEMNKIDRSKLYGSKSVEVLDDRDRNCEMATLAEDGKTLIGIGGTGIGYLTADGNWSDKSDLTAVDMEGNPITPVPSSFAAPILLEQEATMEDYLDHNMRLFYKLDHHDVIPDELSKRLSDGAIFLFDYSYRGGLQADTGFLLKNDDNEIFFLVGDKTGVDFIGLQQTASVGDEESPDASELMSFDMI
ncbi:MAG: hypothetical protein AAF456_20555 [Planctomycetota bacterium]